MKLYPVMMNICNRLTVVVGGGSVAARKVMDLAESEALVKVVSPEFCAEIMETAARHTGRIELVTREYNEGDIDGAVLVFAATDNPLVNESVFRESEEKGILINAADDPPNCNFYVPSYVRKGSFLFSISTGGSSPAFAAKIRRELEKQIPENIDTILDNLRVARDILKTDKAFTHLDSPGRGIILKQLVNDELLSRRIASCANEIAIRELLLEISAL